MEWTAIVNENDEIIGKLERTKINNKVIFRITSLYLTNKNKDVLIAKRSLNKKSNPGKWGPACAGTVEANETYESNCYKEAMEELGLSGVTFEKTTKQKRINPEYKSRYFNQWFKAEVDWPIEKFKIDEKEVSEIKWISKKELEKEFQKNPNQFVSALQEILAKKIKI